MKLNVWSLYREHNADLKVCLHSGALFSPQVKSCYFLIRSVTLQYIKTETEFQIGVLIIPLDIIIMVPI